MNTTNANPAAACCTPTSGQTCTPTRSVSSTNSPVFRPHADIVELQSEFQLKLDVPGATADGLEIQYERGHLTVRAKIAARKPEGRLIGAEYDVGDYVRNFAVGDGVDVERIEASLQNGVLTVRMPKSQALQPRKIQVNAA